MTQQAETRLVSMFSGDTIMFQCWASVGDVGPTFKIVVSTCLIYWVASRYCTNLILVKHRLSNYFRSQAWSSCCPASQVTTDGTNIITKT